MYCNPPWSLAIQYVEHVSTFHAKSPINTKVVIVLQDWPQFNASSTGLRLLCQVPTDTHVFTKPSPLGKRHTVGKVPLPINYRVIDKDTYVKVSPGHVKVVVLSSNIDNSNIANLILLLIGYLQLQH